MHTTQAVDAHQHDVILRAVAAHFPNGSINVYDRELRCLFADGEGLAADGLSPMALVGRRLADVFSPQSVARLEPFYRRAFDGATVRVDLPVLERVYTISAGPLTTEGGLVTAIVAVASDWTDATHREAEGLAREHRARTLAEQANRAKDEFLAIASHELRTPVNAILGWCQLLTKAPTPALADQATRAILRSASHQQRLIEDLLDVSRIASGTLRLTLAEVNATELLTATVEAVLPQAVTKAVQLNARCSEDLGTLQGDQDRLQQALSNVLTNGVKFTPPGGTVSIEGRSTDDGLEVRIIDTGTGISRELLPRVFDRFVTNDGSPQRHAGLGVGLALAKAIVAAHGGMIQVHSEGLGCGTSVTVHLPRLPRL